MAGAMAMNVLHLDDVLPLAIPYPTVETFGVFCTYIVFLAILGELLPSRPRDGVKLKDGSHLVYNCNGLSVFITLLVLWVAGVHYGLFKGSYIYNNWAGFFAAANIVAIGTSVILYVKPMVLGYKAEYTNIVDDFVMGVELNPFLCGLNLKFFWLRPSMMAWTLLNFSMASAEYENLGYISTPMLLFQSFTFIYVFDYFWFEHYMTSTWDIIAENFGVMLVWGDMVFIPFFFSLQGWYLLHGAPTVFAPWQTALIVAIFLLGYTVFRGTNMQKHVFKHNPKALFMGQPQKVIAGRLLCSGFWGFSRHMNYFGDILLAVSYSLPCWDKGLVGYGYPVYLAVLLIHRQWRDDHRCSLKYKKDWEKYCAAVPYRIVPFLY